MTNYTFQEKYLNENGDNMLIQQINNTTNDLKKDLKNAVFLPRHYFPNLEAKQNTKDFCKLNHWDYNT